MDVMAEREYGFHRGIQRAQKCVGQMSASIAHDLSELRLTIPAEDTFASREFARRLANIEKAVERAARQLSESQPH